MSRRSRPVIARIWRGRTTRERADEYEAYNYAAGVRPLLEMALGVQCLREDHGRETEFVTVSYWESVEAMSASPAATRRACTTCRAIRSSSSNYPAVCRS